MIALSFCWFSEIMENIMHTFLIKFSGHQLAEVSPVTWLLQF